MKLLVALVCFVPLFCCCADRKGEQSRHIALPNASAHDERTSAFLCELKSRPRRDGGYIVSFTDPWSAENDNPDSKMCALAGKIPKMYFCDFRFSRDFFG